MKMMSTHKLIPTFSRKENNADVENERHFFRFKILDFLTILNVGYNITKTTRMSYLVQDEHGSYEFIQPYVWNHLCYSYHKPGYSKAVMVCHLTDFHSFYTTA